VSSDGREPVARTPALQARDVVAGYGEVNILHGVSINLQEREMVAVIGPNGAGKSTLLKAVFGLLPLRGGSLFLKGVEATGEQPDKMVRRGLGYVPQIDNVFPSLTIQENLEMGAFVRRNGVNERLDEVYALFPVLASRKGDNAGKLSGGQRQMLALARALMLDPAVLLLDEPSAGLSPKMVGAIFERIAAINEAGTAILLVEQNAREALSVCQRAYVLAMGTNRLEGEARGLLDNAEVGRLYLGA
jgi:ABC-type branched-subunit amino acid transport system ATPase component